MNNFQNGVTSSQLSPQAFKNSDQNVNFQETYSVSGAQSSTTKQALFSTNPGTLTVDDGSNNQVLGVTSVASRSVQSVTSAKSSNYSSVALIVLIVSAALAVYFIKRYKKSAAYVEVESETDEEHLEDEN